MPKKRLTWKEWWRRWRFSAVERYYFEVKDNPTHPFEDLGDGFYYVMVRSDKFTFGFGLIILTTTCFACFCVFVDFYSFPLALFIITVMYGIFSTYGHLSTKELIISRHGGYLMRIRGSNTILLEEPIHNCYIKLQRKFDSNKEPHFYLILGGFRLDDIRITKMAGHDGALRLIGTRLAHRMGINYFDCDNNSTLHQIIHYPSFTTMKPTTEDYHDFLKRHQIEEDEVLDAAEEEDLPLDGSIPPQKIVKRIRANLAAGTVSTFRAPKKINIAEEDVKMLQRAAALRELIRKHEEERLLEEFLKA